MNDKNKKWVEKRDSQTASEPYRKNKGGGFSSGFFSRIVEHNDSDTAWNPDRWLGEFHFSPNSKNKCIEKQEKSVFFYGVAIHTYTGAYF